MSAISSHILDSINGCSAVGIRVQLFKLNPQTQPELVFDSISDNEGRISENVDVDTEQEFELIFHSAAYLESVHQDIDMTGHMSTVVARFTMKDRSQRYHIPLVLSPHSYTFWWSK